MGIFQRLSQLITNNKFADLQPATPIEPIEFPNTYLTIDVGANIPNRTDNAISGTQFGQTILNVPATQQRDNLILQQCMQGNVPAAVRHFLPVIISENGDVLQFNVSGDVLSVGSDTDYLRVSLNGKSAQYLCNSWLMMMPTKKMCDAIWYDADFKVTPQSIPASLDMSNTQTLIQHNTAINNQIGGHSFNLLTGHKKDTVIAKHLLEDRSRIAIYGWFYPTGHPIQGPYPNTTSHSVFYQDYSQSIRLVSRNATLNGEHVDLYDILKNPSLAHLVSDEGAYDPTTIYT